MEPAGPFWKLLRRPQKKLLDDFDPELDAPVKGPLFPRRRVYFYISDENVFFAISFSLSFMLGAPCALVGLFG